MNDHMKQSQGELSELLKEYWKLRHATGWLESLTQTAQYLPIMTEIYMETLANKLGMQVTST